jgi:tRNA A-37 threonylcarbamoyl transferase component Bud32
MVRTRTIQWDFDYGLPDHPLSFMFSYIMLALSLLVFRVVCSTTAQQKTHKKKSRHPKTTRTGMASNNTNTSSDSSPAAEVSSKLTRRGERIRDRRLEQQKEAPTNKPTPVTLKAKRTVNQRADSPEGMVIPNYQGEPSQWTVGPLLAEGAEKKVWLLESTATDKSYAIKIVPTPNKGSKEYDQDVLNAQGLRAEFKLIRDPLQSLQGAAVPRLPSTTDEQSPIAYGEDCEGWNFSVFELMEAELLALVPAMVEEARVQGHTFVDLSKLATRLVDICELLHKRGYVNVDIKPENIMMHQDGNLVFIDFGLTQPIKPEGVTPKGAGTPPFMAFSAHITSPSPREDIESTIYVLMELVLRTRAAMIGEKLKPTDDTYLPWDLPSDEDENVILKEKEKYVKDFGSEFYKSMPADAAQCIKKSLELNWKCEYKSMPKYKEIRKIVSNLTVPFEGNENRCP